MIQNIMANFFKVFAAVNDVMEAIVEFDDTATNKTESFFNLSELYGDALGKVMKVVLSY